MAARLTDRQKLELEIVKLESQVKDSQPEEEAEDNFMDALNGTASEQRKPPFVLLRVPGRFSSGKAHSVLDDSSHSD